MLRKYLVLFLIVLLAGCSEFSNEELLQHYFEIPASDFKNVHTLYEGCEMVRVYLKFQMKNDDAYRRLKKYLDKNFKKEDINKLSNAEKKLYAAENFKWWNPPIISEKCQFFRSGAKPKKNITFGFILINETTQTIYARFINATPE
jgi:hypothetical protein